MAGKVLKMNNMNKINNSAIMNKSVDNIATTHTHNRCVALKNRTIRQELAKLVKNKSFANFYCIFVL